MATQAQNELFEQIMMTSPLLNSIFNAWHQVELPNSWVVAGAIAQTVWNRAHGLPHDFGIRDVDLIYYDADDLSEAAESKHNERINRLMSTVSLRFDVKNEARVHLWYEAKFGYPIEPYVSAESAIATFPTTAGAIGIRPSRSGLEVCAPFGFEDLLGLVVRANKIQITPEIYQAKADRWRSHWPKLKILDWESS